MILTHSKVSSSMTPTLERVLDKAPLPFAAIVN